MIIQSKRFGAVEFTDDDAFIIEGGLVGIPDLRKFLVISHKPDSPFRWIQSVEDPEFAFLVMDPVLFRPDYAPELPDDVAEQLQLTDETPRIVYAIVSIPPGRPEEMTANLAGPIMLNAEKRIARQVVLEDDRWTTRHRILDELDELLKKVAA
ncbi:MAG: flagellar assembly protein FliW [Armatimonadetes bacterium]|nr:flagellar assembly protein FliW [Armatimonadota bacterium]